MRQHGNVLVKDESHPVADSCNSQRACEVQEPGLNLVLTCDGAELDTTASACAPLVTGGTSPETTESAACPSHTPVRYVVTDLDDTFWIPGEKCPEDNIAALKSLKQRNIPVIICTGRSMRSAERGIARFGLDEVLKMFPGIYGDGSIVFGDDRHTVIQTIFLTPKTLDDIATLRRSAPLKLMLAFCTPMGVSSALIRPP